MSLNRILIAEDNEGDVFLIREAFQRAGIEAELVLARDGVDAITELETASAGPGFQLLILDLNLPRKSGLDVLKHFRKSGCPLPPVLIVSSSDWNKDREATLALGASVFFTKPMDYDQFLDIGALAKSLIESPKPAA